MLDRLLHEVYDNLSLPVRSTVGSAGYDFITPRTIVLKPGESILIPTGIRCQMDPDWVLMIYPRSGLGFKYQLSLANTTGIIDEDYFFANNEGHIMVKLVNRGSKVYECDSMTRIVQGIFIPYEVTIDDTAKGERRGGFGSTGE